MVIKLSNEEADRFTLQPWCRLRSAGMGGAHRATQRLARRSPPSQNLRHSRARSDDSRRSGPREVDFGAQDRQRGVRTRRLGDTATENSFGRRPAESCRYGSASPAENAGLSAKRDRAIADLITRVETVAAAGVSVSLRDRSGPEPHSALSELLVEIGRAAAKAGDVAVLVHIDEIQNISDEHALSQLL